MLKIFLEGPDGTQALLNQKQLDIVTPLINKRLSRKQLNKKALEALLAAGMPPDFKAAQTETSTEPPKKLTKQQRINNAVATMECIEYSSDGFVKRYPEPKEFDAALEVLRGLVKE